jgi:lipid A 4'-phosphatase
MRQKISPGLMKILEIARQFVSFAKMALHLGFGRALRGLVVSLALASVVLLSAGRMEKTGDNLQIALPLMALGCSAVNGNAPETLARFAGLMTVVHLQKRTLGEAEINRRPNGGIQGFPSGHTASATFGASRLAQECLRGNPIAKSFAVLSAAFVGGSRISVGAHTYWQVLAGALFALAFDRLTLAMWRRTMTLVRLNTRNAIDSLHRIPVQRLARLEYLTRKQIKGLWFTAFGIAAALFTLFPSLDLGISGLFYDGRGAFPVANWPLAQLFRHMLMNTMHFLALASLFAAVFALVLRCNILFLNARAWAFWATVMILGPGIFVNMILKEYWGRARPAMVENFGGSGQFTPAFWPTDQCAGNCSFVSGEVSGATALALFLILIAYVNRLYFGPRTKTFLYALAIAVPLISVLLRVSAGAHFASDASWAILFTSGFAIVLWPWMMGDERPRLFTAVQQQAARLYGLKLWR